MRDWAGAEVVRLELRAAPLHLFALRSVLDAAVPVERCTAAARAALCLAIHETAALSMLEAIPGSPVLCEFRADDESVGVGIGSIAVCDKQSSQHRLSWSALRSMVTSARMIQRPFDESLGGYRTVTRFTWRLRDFGTAGEPAAGE